MQNLHWSGNHWWEWTPSHKHPTQQIMTTSHFDKIFHILRAGSQGVPKPKSQVPLMLASPNMEATSQLLSTKKPSKYGLHPLEKSDLDYLLQKKLTWLVLKVGPTSYRPNSQHESQASPPASVAM